MNQELKPCPICGGNPEVIWYYIKGTANRRHCFDRCTECKNRPTKYGHSYKTESKAVENWNRSVEEHE